MREEIESRRQGRMLKGTPREEEESRLHGPVLKGLEGKKWNLVFSVEC